MMRKFYSSTPSFRSALSSSTSTRAAVNLAGGGIVFFNRQSQSTLSSGAATPPPQFATGTVDEDDVGYDDMLLDTFLNVEVELSSGNSKSKGNKGEHPTPDIRLSEPSWDQGGVNLGDARPVDHTAIDAKLTEAEQAAAIAEARAAAERGEFTSKPSWYTPEGGGSSQKEGAMIGNPTMRGADADSAMELLKFVESKRNIAKGVEDESFSVPEQGGRLKFWWEEGKGKRAISKAQKGKISKSTANNKYGQVQKKMSYMEFDDFKSTKHIREGLSDINKELAMLPRTLFDDGQQLADLASSTNPTIAHTVTATSSSDTLQNKEEEVRTFVNVDGDEVYEGEGETKERPAELTKVQEDEGRLAVRNLMGNLFKKQSAVKKRKVISEHSEVASAISRKSFSLAKGKLEAQRIRETNGRILATMEATNVPAPELERYKAAMIAKAQKVPMRDL